MRIPKWNITELTGYEQKTTFWMDFCIADKFGLDAVKDTYNRVMKEWSNDYIYMTELAMVMNHLCWLHYYCTQDTTKQFLNNHAELGQWYKDQYYILLDWADEHLKGEELTYFYKTID